ncbi:MAG TPA: 50S ribosomal protein L2 [Methanomicrobia archaeon]|nr:50S ribosomal protein L2 [Methanomicrobia archaeon]
MGKRIIAQRRGRGSPTFKAPSHKYKGKLEHLRVNKNETVLGKIAEIVHDPARSTPIARLTIEKREGEEKEEKTEERFVVVPEGVGVGDEMVYGESAAIKTGNTLPLRCIPEGITVCNLEARPNDGGKFARASGNFATLLAHEQETETEETGAGRGVGAGGRTGAGRTGAGAGKTLVVMPSGKKKWLSSDCFATIGVVAGGGRTEKPFVKAGKKYHKMKARAAKYPTVRGVAMNSVDHPFGGGGHQHVGKSKTPGKGAPPGRKVGSIAAKRTGRGGKG